MKPRRVLLVLTAIGVGWVYSLALSMGQFRALIDALPDTAAGLPAVDVGNEVRPRASEARISRFAPDEAIADTARPSILPDVSDLHGAADESDYFFDEAYDDSYDDGYDDTADESYDDGYDDSYDDTADDSYDDGYDDSYDDTVDDSYADSYDDDGSGDQDYDEGDDDGYGEWTDLDPAEATEADLP